MQRVGRAVAARRGELGLTQQELADDAGIDIKTVYNLESGGRWPIAKNRAALAVALRWEPDALAVIAAGRAPGTPPAAGELESQEPPAPPPLSAVPPPLGGDRHAPEYSAAGWIPPLPEEKLTRAWPFFIEIVSRLLTAAPDPGGEVLFPDSETDALTWDLRAQALNVEQRAWLIAVLRADEATAREQRPGAGSGGALPPDPGRTLPARNNKPSDTSVPGKPLPERRV